MLSVIKLKKNFKVKEVQSQTKKTLIPWQGFCHVHTKISPKIIERARENVMKSFKEGKIKTLVATDVAARGIDIKNVGLVVNYELPENPESYVHRIGRTGRAGREGVAISLVADSEKRRLYRIKGLKNVKPERFKYNSLKVLKEEILSLNPNEIPEEAKKLSRELLKEIDAENIVSFFISKLIYN
jgi:ATP-dependent RNA helicase DeaD